MQWRNTASCGRWMRYRYCACNIHSVKNIGHTFIILNCTRFCPQNSLNSSGHSTRCWKQFTGMLAQFDSLTMLPKVVSSWLDVHWVVDHSWYIGETIGHGKPSSIACLDTLRAVRLAPTTIPHLKALKYLFLPIHPLNGTHTQSMSQLSKNFKNPSLTCLLPFIYTDWSGFNNWHQNGIIAFTWIHLVSLCHGNLDVLYTQCIAVVNM